MQTAKPISSRLQPCCCCWAAVFLLMTVAAAAEQGVEQDIEAVQYRHLYTFGSKQGIQPPRLLNRRAAKLVLGEGDPPYGIAAPSGVIADDRNRVWIADGGAASLHVFDRSTGAYRQIRPPGDVPMSGPAGIAIDRQGRIYVTDAPSGRVLGFDKTGEYARTVTPTKGERLLQSPTGIAVSENARTLYVLDPPRRVVVALNQEGESVATFGQPGELSVPAAISVVGDDVWVLDTGLRRVRIFTASGRLRRDLDAGGVTYPSGLAYDSVRHRYFVGNPSLGIVQGFDEKGRNIGVFGGLGDAVDQVRKIDALYVDPQGRVYVIDTRGGKVVVFGETPAR